MVSIWNSWPVPGELWLPGAGTFFLLIFAYICFHLESSVFLHSCSCCHSSSADLKTFITSEASERNSDSAPFQTNKGDESPGSRQSFVNDSAFGRAQKIEFSWRMDLELSRVSWKTKDSSFILLTLFLCAQWRHELSKLCFVPATLAGKQYTGFLNRDSTRRWCIVESANIEVYAWQMAAWTELTLLYSEG